MLFFDEFDAIGEEGHAPWTRLFGMLDDLRAWGPEDRFSAEARVALEEHLAEDEAAEHRLELEVWPTRSQERRERWRGEAERRVAALGGRVLSRSSIEEEGFIHEALLVGGAERRFRAGADGASGGRGRAGDAGRAPARAAAGGRAVAAESVGAAGCAGTGRGSGIRFGDAASGGAAGRYARGGASEPRWRGSHRGRS